METPPDTTLWLVVKVMHSVCHDQHCCEGQSQTGKAQTPFVIPGRTGIAMYIFRAVGARLAEELWG